MFMDAGAPLYVHTMAANEAALNFYRSQGFIVCKEETVRAHFATFTLILCREVLFLLMQANMAHRRGLCLDGLTGGGKSVLLHDQS